MISHRTWHSSLALVALVAVPGALGATARPVITVQPAGVVAESTPRIAWRGLPEAVYTWWVTSGGREVVRPRRGRLSSVRVPALPDGTYTFVVTQTLPGGRRSPEALSRPFRIDRTPPGAPRFLTPPRPVTGSAVANASWEGESGGTFSVELRGESTRLLAIETTERATTLPRLDSGAYTLQVTQIDDAGNLGRPVRATFTVDRTPSTALSISPAGPDIVNRPPDFRISAPAGSTVSWTLAGPVTRSGTGASILIGEIPDGRYRLAVDAVGAGARSLAVEFTLDRVAPPAPSMTAIVGLPGSGTAQVGWTGEVTGRLSWELLAGGRRLRGPEILSDARPISLTGLSAGTYTVRAAQLDPAGNASAPVSATFAIQDRPPEAAIPSTRPGPSVPPRGVTRPVPGAIIERTQPLLRWRLPATGVRPYAYNIQIFRERAKVHSGFSRGNLYRIPPDVLVSSGRYYWQVWAYDAKRRAYRDAPIAIGYFDTGDEILQG